MDKVYPKPLPIQEFGQLLLNMKLIDKVPPHLRLDSDANNEWYVSHFTRSKMTDKLIQLDKYLNKN